MTKSFTVSLNDAAKTEIEVLPNDRDVASYGLVQAILQAIPKSEGYQAANAAEMARMVDGLDEEDAQEILDLYVNVAAYSISIDGQEVTEF